MADYRIFVGAFISGPLREDIQAIRQKYDPKTARITPPHITVAGTYWRSGPPTPENEAGAIEKLSHACLEISPFDLLLKGVKTFPPQNHPIIYLDVEITEGLLAARQKLLRVLGMDKHGSRFAPHLTIAMRLDKQQADALLMDLRGSRWDVEKHAAAIKELRLMQRGSADPVWRAIGIFPLGGK